MSRVRCVAGWGLEGDRFFAYKPGYKGQITFFAWAEYQRLCATFGLVDESPAVLRRNVVTEGVDLLTLIGREFEVQGVRFRGHSECSPCYWMEQVFCPGAAAALRGRGGLRAQILSDGFLSSGRGAEEDGKFRPPAGVVVDR